jgi:hypothetical protein
MATEAHRILLCDWRVRPRTEINDSRRLLAFDFDVCPAGSVARLTLEASMPERAARIVRHRVFRAENSRERGIIMAIETGIGALRAVSRRRDNGTG